MLDSPTATRLPKAELKAKIECFYYDKWGDEFSEYDGARMGKLFYNGPDKNKAKYVCKLPRMKLARFIRLVSGHNSLFYFRSKVDPEIRPTCRFCLEEDETFWHIINHCPRFFTYRREQFADQIIQNDHRWRIDELISFSYLPGINHALEGDTGLEWFGDGAWNDGNVSTDSGGLDEPSGIG